MDLTLHNGQICNIKMKLCYGLGHILNDLCAAIWFSYTLFFLQIIVTLDSSTAGLFVMIGQVADALTTPIAGWIIDRTKVSKAWYITGTLAVVIGFAMCYCSKPEYLQMSMTAYYLTFVILFQIGWAVVQISHLSVLPIISTDKACSNELTAIRHTASICCNIIVYILAWVILEHTANTTDEIGPNDNVKFMIIAIIVLCIGVITSIIYYIGVNYNTNEISIKQTNTNSTNPNNNNNNNNDNDNESKNICNIILKSLVVYFVSVMYMCARLYSCLILLYIPLYLHENKDLIGDIGGGLRGAIAIIPFILFICSFFTALCLKFLNKIIKNLIIYLIGAGISLAACLWIVLDNTDGFYTRVSVNVALMGVGNSMTMISSLCMTANYVKIFSMRGGLVYSSVTFTDKLITGIVVYLIQTIDCVENSNCSDFYLRIFYVCGITPCVGVVALLLLITSLKFLRINH